jgi:hypothetical protein
MCVCVNDDDGGLPTRARARAALGRGGASARGLSAHPQPRKVEQKKINKGVLFFTGSCSHTHFLPFPLPSQKTLSPAVMQAALSTRAAVAVRPAAAKSSAFKVWQPTNSKFHRRGWGARGGPGGPALARCARC